MNFLKIKQTLLILSIVSLSACESMISDVAVPESKPKLVINGYLSPENDTLKVNIQESEPLYTPSTNFELGYPVVTDAVVKISDGNKSITLIYNNSQKKYLAVSDVFNIEPGSTYYLEVSTPRGDLATSSCTIPNSVIPEIEITNIETFNDYGYIEKVVSFRFKDVAGEGDFYHVQAGILYVTEFGEDFMGETYLEKGEPFESDVNKDGSYFLYKTGRIGGQVPNQTSLHIYIFIGVTDENYFNYHRSVTNFQDDNPFSEPTPVYTNITGGLGVFGSYSGRIISINLK
jgi:hypothetical protein